MAPTDIIPITALEPLAGAGLAINVAYLALNRFRYRSEIEPLAEQKCIQNDTQTFKGFNDLDPVKELKWLARRTKSEVFVPRGKGALAYRYAFRKHQDVYLSAAAATLCALTLTSGVAFSIDRWAWVKAIMLQWPIPGVLFYGCLLSLLLPAISIPLGRRCVKWGKLRIDYCTRQVAITLGNLAEHAKAPEGVPVRTSRAIQSRERLVIDPLTGGYKLITDDEP